MYYSTREGDVRAVDDVSFTLEKGTTLGIAGESGSGKSSLAYTLMKLLPQNGSIRGGKITIAGVDVSDMPEGEVRSKVRWKHISLVPQSAMNALNPVFKVGEQISEAILVHQDTDPDIAIEKSKQMLELVGIDPRRYDSYPHELSGGMRQRAMIAMALVLNPDIIVADEPTTALDVIVQAQIIQLLKDLKRTLSMSLILITHDLSLVAEMSDMVIIFYAGQIVEYGSSEALFVTPAHPYTFGLIHAFPNLKGPKTKLISIPGTPPDLVAPPSGCRFNPRCQFATQICREVEPELRSLNGGRLVRCHHAEEVLAKSVR